MKHSEPTLDQINGTLENLLRNFGDRTCDLPDVKAFREHLDNAFVGWRFDRTYDIVYAVLESLIHEEDGLDADRNMICRDVADAEHDVYSGDMLDWLSENGQNNGYIVNEYLKEHPADRTIDDFFTLIENAQRWHFESLAYRAFDILRDTIESIDYPNPVTLYTDAQILDAWHALGMPEGGALSVEREDDTVCVTYFNADEEHIIYEVVLAVGPGSSDGIAFEQR